MPPKAAGFCPRVPSSSTARAGSSFASPALLAPPVAERLQARQRLPVLDSIRRFLAADHVVQMTARDRRALADEQITDVVATEGRRDLARLSVAKGCGH